VALVKGEGVEPLLVRSRVKRKGLCFDHALVRTPPELDPVENLCDFFVVVHGKKKGAVALGGRFSFELSGSLRRVLSEVGLDGSEKLTVFQTFA